VDPRDRGAQAPRSGGFSSPFSPSPSWAYFIIPKIKIFVKINSKWRWAITS